MPQLTLKYLMALGRPVLLLTESERLRLRARVEDFTRKAEIYRAAGLMDGYAQILCQLDTCEQEMETDDEISGLPEVETCVIEYIEPTRDHQRAVRDAGADPADQLAAAIEMLVPRVTSGWEGEEIPLAFWPAIEEACSLACFPNPSEDRRFFSIARSVA